MKDLAVTILLGSSEDEEDRSKANRLKAHLSPLIYEKLIALWDYSNIIPGFDWEKEMDKHLEEAQIILFLVSASFLASPYWYSVVQQAMERYERKKVRVIHVILSDCMWERTLLNRLKPLPDDGASIADWANRGKGWDDKAYKNVATGIFKVVEELKAFSLSDERKTLKANFYQLIEPIMSQMTPPNRAEALVYTLHQLKMIAPNDVTLADLVVGWRILSDPSKQREEPAVEERRKTCRELARIVSQLTGSKGNLGQAIQIWNLWAKAFKRSSDPRNAAMAKTFARELKELQEAAAIL